VIKRFHLIEAARQEVKSSGSPDENPSRNSTTIRRERKTANQPMPEVRPRLPTMSPGRLGFGRDRRRAASAPRDSLAAT